MKFPLSFRSNSTWMLLVGGGLTVLSLIELYVPLDLSSKYTIGGGFLLAMFGTIGYYTAKANLQGPKHPHAIVTRRVWPTGNPQQQDFFFSSELDPLKKILDVVSLMEQAAYCEVCKAWRKAGELAEGKCPKCKVLLKLRDLPIWRQGRWWWSYLMRTWKPVYWDDLKSDFTFHIFVLPFPREDFFGHYSREHGAYIDGEQIDHPDSECITVYGGPFTHSFLDEEIPVYVGIEGKATFDKVTRSWAPTLEAIAQIDHQRVVTEHPEMLWPNRTLEEVMREPLDDAQKKIVLEVLARAKKR